MYLRNIKKGFATNSSSYHSTIFGYIELPEEIWLEFKDSVPSSIESFGTGKVIKGIILKDDEDKLWHSYSQMENESDRIEVYNFERDGRKMVEVTVEYNDD